MWNFVTEFARNQIKIKSSVDKAFWDETKSFLQYNAALVEKREENTCEPVFSITTKTTATTAELCPKGKTVTAAYIHKPLGKI